MGDGRLQRIEWEQIRTTPRSGSTIELGSENYPLKEVFSDFFTGDGSRLTNLPSQYSILNQETPSMTWNFQHNANIRFVNIQVYKTNGEMVIPDTIECVDENNAIITFAYPLDGVAIATFG